jgi:hypothetical protein
MISHTLSTPSRFVCDLLSHLRTARLGYESDDKVLQHEYFDGIDFKGLYMGPGPFAVEFCGAGDTRCVLDPSSIPLPDIYRFLSCQLFEATH